MSADKDMLKECVDRIRRVETRLIVLGNKLGHDLTETDNLDVDVDAGKVDILTMDVALSNIIRAAHQAGLSNMLVEIHFKGTLVAAAQI